MKRIGTTRPVKASSSKKAIHNNETSSQRLRLVEYLISKPITTLEARRELDIMSPAPRILELRKQGCNIVTHWIVEDGHRIARYVLLPREPL